MSQKRNRAINWDEEEKHLLCSLLKQYPYIIENKTLDTNTSKAKNKAWENVHKKFNELSGRPRQLSQLKIQWKNMKINARKKYSTYKKELNKTGGGARPPSPTDVVIEIKDLLNPAELVTDQNIYDSDSVNLKLCELESTRETCTSIILQDTTLTDSPLDAEFTMDQKPYNCDQFLTSTLSQEEIIEATPVKNKNPKNSSKTGSISKKVHGDYVGTMISHSKKLKDEEHKRKMEMAEEEHAIKIKIHMENLKSAILDREILELKKAHELQKRA